MNNMLQDLRYAFRMLASRPGFSATAVLVLALGIGANSAVFSLIDAFLLKPLAIRDADRLQGIYSRDSKHPGNYRGFSLRDFRELRGNNPVFSDVMAYNVAMVGITEGDTTRRSFAAIVSSSYFSTLGVSLHSGRTFFEEEDAPGSNGLSAIVSYPFWKRSGSDPRILGKQLQINGRFFTVVGVTPEGFSGTTALVSPALFVPLRAYDMVINDFEGHGKRLAAPDNHPLMMVGRLRPGLTQRDADSRLKVLSARLEQAYPAENKDQILIAHQLSRMSISTEPHEESGLRVPAVLLMSLAGVILAIASLNLSNMMLARGASRRKEIAIRLAIGGGRRRIIQQLLTEGLVLAALGGAVGLVAASWGTVLLIGSLAALSPLDLVFDPRPDVRVIAATMAFCALSTLIFALFPAWKLSRPDLSFDLKESSSGDFSSGRVRFLSRRNLLVIGQLSLSLMMLSAAGLFIHSALRAADVQPGFAMTHQIIAETDPSLIDYNEVRGRQVYAEIQRRLARIPGVQAVGLAATVPFGMVSLGRKVNPSGVQISKDHPGLAMQFNIVGDDYFRAMDIPVLRGGVFAPGKNAQVAVLDKLAATTLWPGGEAVGKHIRLDEGGSGDGSGVSADGPQTKQANDYEVVGVVGDVKESILGSKPQPHVYVSFAQTYQANMNLHVRFTGNGENSERGMLEAVRREIRTVDPRLPVLALKTMRGHLESGIDIWVVRTGARMLEIFGAMALFLAVIGLYAVNAYTVSRRTREIGIRMALGANRSSALSMILADGLKVTAAGLVVGLLLSAGLGQVLAGILYEVKGLDAMVLVSSTVILALVSLLACYLPARKASLVDPMIALRCE